MKPISDDDLVLLYYGEHEDPGLAARVAGDEELSRRFDAIGAELGQLDRFAPPPRDEDYGADTWRAISARLAESDARPAGLLESLRNVLARPRFNLAGVAAVAFVAVLAFLLGRQGAVPVTQPPVEPVTPALAATELDTQRLLTASVSDHLEQMNIVLTEFANGPESPNFGAERATDLLVSNRLYRQAAAARGDQKLASFLASLEPLLIELAYEAWRDSPQTRDRMQQEVRERLLFRVRAVGQQLQNTTVST
jgi:hypothetical protein